MKIKDFDKKVISTYKECDISENMNRINKIINSTQRKKNKLEPPRLALIGSFNAGKSTLFNKIQSHLINNLTNQQKRDVGLNPKDQFITMYYYTQEVANPELVKYDEELYQDKVYKRELNDDSYSNITFIDTPGIDDEGGANIKGVTDKFEIVESFLDEIDCILFCFSVSKSLAEDDAKMIKKILSEYQHIDIYFVLTNCDRLMLREKTEQGTLITNKYDEVKTKEFLEDEGGLNSRIAKLFSDIDILDSTLYFFPNGSKVFMIDSEEEIGLDKLYNKIKYIMNEKDNIYMNGIEKHNSQLRREIDKIRKSLEENYSKRKKSDSQAVYDLKKSIDVQNYMFTNLIEQSNRMLENLVNNSVDKNIPLEFNIHRLTIKYDNFVTKFMYETESLIETNIMKLTDEYYNRVSSLYKYVENHINQVQNDYINYNPISIFKKYEDSLNIDNKFYKLLKNKIDIDLNEFNECYNGQIKSRINIPNPLKEEDVSDILNSKRNEIKDSYIKEYRNVILNANGTINNTFKAIKSIIDGFCNKQNFDELVFSKDDSRLNSINISQSIPEINIDFIKADLSKKIKDSNCEINDSVVFTDKTLSKDLLAKISKGIETDKIFENRFYEYRDKLDKEAKKLFDNYNNEKKSILVSSIALSLLIGFGITSAEYDLNTNFTNIEVLKDIALFFTAPFISIFAYRRMILVAKIQKGIEGFKRDCKYENMFNKKDIKIKIRELFEESLKQVLTRKKENLEEKIEEHNKKLPDLLTPTFDYIKESFSSSLRVFQNNSLNLHKKISGDILKIVNDEKDQILKYEKDFIEQSKEKLNENSKKDYDELLSELDKLK